MNDAASSGHADPLATQEPAEQPEGANGLHAVHPSYERVLLITFLLVYAPIPLLGAAADHLWIAEANGPVWLLTSISVISYAMVAAWVPQRRYKRIGYQLGDKTLRVARGYLFRVDTIVPFVRVQHIDLSQGPIERLYDLSSLVVHTSGTLNSTVTLPGLPTAIAARMRDTIRSHIQSDFA